MAGVQIQCLLDKCITPKYIFKALSRLVGSAFFYINVSNFKGLIVTILRLYFILKIFSISGINLSISYLTLKISIAELIWLTSGQSDKQFLLWPLAR